MKANQFAQNDEAVSPVIGVILMVAITVVLAAVVFVLVSDLGDTGDSAPQMSFTKSEGDDQIKVAKADTGLNWDQFQIKASVTNATDLEMERNTAADGTGGTAVTSSATSIAAGSVTAGDYFEFCGTSTAQTAVTITLIHEASNTEVYSTTFSSIAAC